MIVIPGIVDEAFAAVNEHALANVLVHRQERTSNLARTHEELRKGGAKAREV